MEIPKNELPEWASGGWRSEKMTPEDQIIHRLKYDNDDEWFDDMIQKALEEMPEQY